MSRPSLTKAQQAYLAAVRSDPMVFMQQAFQSIYPRQQLMLNWHIDAMVNCLEQGRAGLMPRLIINLPPRHLKSYIASIAWPAFLLGHDPSAKVICVSYSDDLARTLSREFKRIVESTWYRQVFPHVRFTKTTENELVTTQGGFRYATSVNGTLTGRGADFILVDDPIKPDDAASDRARKALNDWYSTTLLSRLDDKQRSVLTIVMQRLHVNDLTSYVEAGGGFKKLSFPAIARCDERIALRNGRWHVRRAGEALQSERESLALLQGMRDQMGEFIFASQYQQSPQTPDGTLFKLKCFRFIEEAPRRRPEGRLILSIDTAISDAPTADFTALSLVYLENEIFTVLSSQRGRWTYETLKAVVLRYRAIHGEELIFVIENAGVGTSLIRFLRDAEIPCLHYQPRGDKVARAAWALPVFADGRVQVLNKPGQNDWVEPWVNESMNFPFGRFDDQVDSLVQLIHCEQRLATWGGRVEIIY